MEETCTKPSIPFGRATNIPKLVMPTTMASNTCLLYTSGMGSDLFESYVGSIISAMTLGVLTLGFNGILLPMIIAAAGIIASIIGTFFVKTDEKSNPLKDVYKRQRQEGVPLSKSPYATPAVHKM